jgi:hypothetical protein
MPSPFWYPIGGGKNYLTLTVNHTAEVSDVTYIVEVTSNLASGWVSDPRTP